MCVCVCVVIKVLKIYCSTPITTIHNYSNRREPNLIPQPRFEHVFKSCLVSTLNYLTDVYYDYGDSA